MAAAALGGLASRPAESTWYGRLKKPSFQPPRQAFPIVWPLLYADIAAVSASTLDHLRDHDREQARTYAALLGANLVVNAGWTWLFFTRRQLGVSALAASGYTRRGARSRRCCRPAFGNSIAAVEHAE